MTRKLDTAMAQLQIARSALDRASTVVERAIGGGSIAVRAATPKRAVRRPAQLDRDAELRAFVLARLDAMPYEKIAEEIAEQFPPRRHVRKSAIHAWAKRRREEEGAGSE